MLFRCVNTLAQRLQHATVTRGTWQRGETDSREGYALTAHLQMGSCRREFRRDDLSLRTSLSIHFHNPWCMWLRFVATEVGIREGGVAA